MTSPPTYGTLFTYLKNHIRKKESAEPFHLVRKFSALHGIDADALTPILKEFGGYDDLEVLFNVVGRIPEEALIGTPVETPEQYAVRNGLYCRRADGGLVECSADAPSAEPDLNRAVVLMSAGV